MDTLETVRALVGRDDAVTQQFFFKNCRPLFVSILKHVFTVPVDYDECINAFYLYLMENDAARLLQFRNRSSIYQWLKVVAISFFIMKRDRWDASSAEELPDDADVCSPVVDCEQHTSACMDLAALLKQMTNRRYAYVIRRLLLDEAEPDTVARELNVTTANLYNIKRRALANLTEIALNDIEHYGNRFSK
ncbi:MAG: sigma-70 family RNA polymerase sigma factor [Candidatus Cryptobacteroides sp.]